MFFHWEYLNETMKQRSPRRADQVGHLRRRRSPTRSRAAEISQAIDTQFRNSLAETLTETEQAFQLGFVTQTEAIVIAIRIVSFVVIFIILAVMANTMAMTARERLAEYATLKALGFGPGYVAAPHLRRVAGDRGDRRRRSASRSRSRSRRWLQAGRWARCSRCFEVTPRDGRDAARAARWRWACSRRSLPALRAARVRIVEGLRTIG